MQELSKEDYINEIKYCYDNSRWEFSFYPVLYLFLCQFRNGETKLVHSADWKSRGKNTSLPMKKKLESCSVNFESNNGKTHIGGIPDFQFVPSNYSYDEKKVPYKAKVFVEFKSPIFNDKVGYQRLEYTETSEIQNEIQSCGKLILTDGISWYFLKSQNSDITKKIVVENQLVLDLGDNLHNDRNWEVLKGTISKFIEET